jgi:hypothetical protein
MVSSERCSDGNGKVVKQRLAKHLSLRRMTLPMPTSGIRQCLPVNTYVWPGKLWPDMQMPKEIKTPGLD